MKLDNAFVDSVRPAILRTWNGIGHDIEEACEGDNEIAIEACIDGGNFESYATVEQRDAIHDAYMEHGSRTVIFLAKHITLV